MQSEEEKQYLLEAIDSMDREFIVISPNLKIVAANEYAKKIHQQELLGKKCYELYSENKQPCKGCPLVNILGTQDKEQIPFPNHTLDSNKKNICHALRSEEKIEVCLRLNYDDSQMDQLKQKLQRSNAFLHNLILNSVDAIIAADMQGNIIIFNEAASEILGYSREEAMQNLNIREIYPEGQAEEIMQKLRSEEYGPEGKIIDYRVQALDKNGELIPIRLNASIIYEKNKMVASIGFFHDLRQNLKIEKELEETRIQLFQSAKMAALGKLAAGVAHQINNPLGGISLFAQILMEEYDLDENAQQDVRRILDEAKRCKETVKELLEFARQSSKENKPQDINKAIDRTIFLLEKHALFQDICIEKNFDPDLPFVPCDLQQMSHVIMNIILNAAQAMQGHGQMGIKTSRIGDEYVQLEFSDTGPGFSEDVLPKIFDPFFTTKEEGKGTGLGLSVAYRIVQNHGGNIVAENNPTQGAVFRIKLPCKPEVKGDAHDG